MNEGDDDAARQMAYHESAHAVLAVRQGFTLNWVELKELSPGEWVGESDSSDAWLKVETASPDDRRKSARVALGAAHARRKRDPGDAEDDRTWRIFEEHDRLRAERLLGCAEGSQEYAECNMEAKQLVERPENWAAIQAVARGLLAKVTDTGERFPRHFRISGPEATALMDG